MKRYLLDVDVASSELHRLPTRGMQFDFKRKIVLKYYKKYVIPFAEQHNLNYKREEWRFGVSLKRSDLVALTLILPTEATLMLDPHML